MLTAINTSVLIILGILTAITLHKVIRIHRMLYPISAATKEIRDEVLQLFRQLQHLENLRAKLALDDVPSLRGWAAAPDFLSRLIDALLLHRHPIIIELGAGSSTIIIARTLQLLGGGHLFSLEHYPSHAANIIKSLERNKLSNYVTILQAPLRDTPYGVWYTPSALDAIPKDVDFLIVDGPPNSDGIQARYPALPILQSYLKPGCTIFVDDTKRPDDRHMVERWHKEGLTSQPVFLDEDEHGTAILFFKAPKTSRQVNSEYGS